MAKKYNVIKGKEACIICNPKGVFRLSEKISQAKLKMLYDFGHTKQIQITLEDGADNNTATD